MELRGISDLESKVFFEEEEGLPYEEGLLSFPQSSCQFLKKLKSCVILSITENFGRMGLKRAENLGQILRRKWL